MTENENNSFLRECKALAGWFDCRRGKTLKLNDNGIDTVIKTLEEIQQYRSIGTVEECQKAVESQKAKRVITVKARNEKENVLVGDFVHYKCPNCGKKIGSAFHYPPNEYMMEHKFCDECSQKFDWYEAKRGDNQKI